MNATASNLHSTQPGFVLKCVVANNQVDASKETRFSLYTVATTCGLQAVRREVQEEVGVRVGEVAIVGSQPWPIGRGGSCELMIGCVATAEDDAIHLNEAEVGAVWLAWMRILALCLCTSHRTVHPRCCCRRCRLPSCRPMYSHGMKTLR